MTYRWLQKFWDLFLILKNQSIWPIKIILLSFFLFFSMPYYGDQEQCLGMKCPDNLLKQVTFGVVVQSSALNPLVGSKPSPIKHLTVTNPDNFWTYQWFSDIHPPFDALPEEYLCALKILLSWSICRLFHSVIP